MIGLLVDEAAIAQRVREGVMGLFWASLALGLPACSDLAEPGAGYDGGAAAGGVGGDPDGDTGDGGDGSWDGSGAEDDEGETGAGGDDGATGDGTTDDAGPSTDSGEGADGTGEGDTSDGSTGGTDDTGSGTSTWDDGTDPCAGLELPPCPEACTAAHGDCGDPCEEAYGEGYTCGDELGNGMICEGGEWVCITADPPKPGACDVVCEP
jgi:hypothetical protein